MSRTLRESKSDVLHTTSRQETSRVWCPPTDVYETEDSYVVMVEIAAMSEENIVVTIESNILYVRGTRINPHEGKANYLQREIRFEKFETSAVFPGAVNPELTNAEYKDGILKVSVPKYSPQIIGIEEKFHDNLSVNLAGDETTDAPPPKEKKEER